MDVCERRAMTKVVSITYQWRKRCRQQRAEWSTPGHGIQDPTAVNEYTGSRHVLEVTANARASLPTSLLAVRTLDINSWIGVFNRRCWQAHVIGLVHAASPDPLFPASTLFHSRMLSIDRRDQPLALI